MTATLYAIESVDSYHRNYIGDVPIDDYDLFNGTNPPEYVHEIGSSTISLTEGNFVFTSGGYIHLHWLAIHYTTIIQQLI